MRTYVFENMRGTVAKVTANSIDEAIAIFKRTYVGWTYSFVAEE